MPYRLTYRELFFGTHGVGPFDCYFCDTEITSSRIDIHHEDGDHSNNDVTNLKPAHRGCHTRHHKERWWADGNKPRPADLTPEDRSVIARRGWKTRDREQAATAMRQRWADPVWAERQKEKLREVWRRRKAA